MSDYTAAEITEVECSIDWAALSWEEDGHRLAVMLRGEPVAVDKIASKPGEEEGGSNVFVVVKVGDQLFRKDGYYASHYGTDWDGAITEVRPSEKTVTVYESA